MGTDPIRFNFYVLGQSAIRKFGNLVSRKNGQPEIRKKLVLHVLWLVLHVLATPVSTLELFSEWVSLRNLGVLICHTFPHHRVPRRAAPVFILTDGSVGGSFGGSVGRSV